MSQRQLPDLPAGSDLWRTEELLHSGLTWHGIDQLVASRAIVRLRRGCYVRTSAWDPLGPAARNRMLLSAHAHGTLAISKGGSVYSHTSGARLHRLNLWKVDGRVHLTQETLPSKSSHGADVIAHTRALSSREIVEIDGLPCTSLERTVVDCCLMLNVKQSLILMDNALRNGADLDSMRQACLGLAGRKGVRTLRRVLVIADPRSESPGETLTRELLVRLHLPMPDLQVEVLSPAGRHRLDFAWKKAKVALEFDGRSKYFDYRPTDEVLFQERLREKALTEQGWRFIRVQWKDLFQEADFKARILRALAQGPYALPA